MTRVAYDLSILRHPHAGTARYAQELLAAMRVSARDNDRLVPTNGFPRGPRDTRLRRYLHLAEDLAWSSVGASAVAAAGHVDAWFGPSNTLPLALPRPCVVTIHDANLLSRPTDYARGYRTYAVTMFRHAARRGDRILTVSRHSAEEIIRGFGAQADRVVVAYPGIDHVLRTAPAPRPAWFPDRFALFVGQTEPHKNLGLLLDAWQVGVPGDLHLVIAGPKGRDDDRLRAVVESSKVRDRIHFVGRVPDASLAALYAAATCFVLPSRIEGFGFPPLEAMARGVPTAVASTGSLPEVTGEGALHFDPDDAVALAALIRALVEDEAMRARIRAEGLRVSGRYRWAETARVAWAAVHDVTRHV